jgi:hypothetical protein
MITAWSSAREPNHCSVPLLDWTGDKRTELIQDQAHIQPAPSYVTTASRMRRSEEVLSVAISFLVLRGF